MKAHEASQIAKLLATVATNPAFGTLNDEGIRCVARAIVDTELRDMGVPYTEPVFNARNACVRVTVRMANVDDGSTASATAIKDYLEGFVTGAFETAGVMEW